ncbi:MAG TPA: hypothetical protein VFZ78_07395, partial [Flavisolibacter sp.]
MKKTPSFLPVALVLVLATTSCRSYRYPYAASHIHQPLLVKKQDASLDATYSFGPAKGRADSSSNRGMDLQAAYAFSNHIAVMASWAFRRESDGFQNDYENIYDTSLVRYRRNFFEAGAGYFTADAGRKFVFSVYGGVGKGTLHIDDAIRSFGVSDTRFYSADLLKYFLQPGISFVEDENVHAAVCIRFSYVTY